MITDTYLVLFITYGKEYKHLINLIENCKALTVMNSDIYKVCLECLWGSENV